MHYDAFISYKHEKKDIEVAKRVQAGLERFQVPASIKKRTGKKKIERIFRDKDELPITSDLGETISEALDNSDYLIVICSTHTRESVWVQREIDYFLKTHSKREVLTVLVDGEPGDVIPPILLNDEKTETDENGNERKIITVLEPLSCDYRVPNLKARIEELPRLASVLLGCTYDELMNRRRQYFLRRIVFIFAFLFALAVAFGGYMRHSRDRINESYREVLRNQARYLASESELCLQNSDRITAMQLAKHALSITEGEATPEALRALTLSTYSYVSPSDGNIKTVWNYTMPNSVCRYEVSEDRKYLAANDFGGVFSVWDTESHEEVLHIKGTEGVYNGIEFANNLVIVWNGEMMEAYELESSSLKWKIDIDTQLVNQDTIMIIGDEMYLMYSDWNICKLDINDGSIKEKKSIKSPLIPETFYFEEVRFSPDGKKMCFEGTDGNGEHIGCVDLDTYKVVISDRVSDLLGYLGWADEDKVVFSYNTSEHKNGLLDDVYIYSKDHSRVVCMDVSDMSVIWENEYINTGVSLNPIMYPLSNGREIVYANGSVAEIYDLKTGRVISNHNVNETIINIKESELEGILTYITSSGSIVTPDPNDESDTVNSRKILPENLANVITNGGFYVNQTDSNNIIYYAFGVYDQEWTCIDDNVTLDDVGNEYYMDEHFLVTVTSVESQRVATFIDPGEGKLISQIPLDKMSENCYSLDCLNSTESCIYAVLNTLEEKKLFRIGPEGKKTEELLSFEAEDISKYSMQGNLFVYMESAGDQSGKVNTYNVETGEKQSFSLKNPGDSDSYAAPVFSSESNTIYVPDVTDRIINTENGEVTNVELPEDWDGTRMVKPDSNGGAFIVSDSKNIAVINKSGTIRYNIICPGIEPVGMEYYSDINMKNDEIIVFYSNGAIYRYLFSTGAFLGRIQGTSRDYFFKVKFLFDYDGNNLYIQADNLTEVIDLRTWVLTAEFDKSIGYYPPKDIFYTVGAYEDKKIMIGYFRHYTADELRKKAEEQLQGQEMTEEQKSEYGIK